MSKKLLLADDSVTIQRVIELTFSGEDIQVLTVGDGEEAIARIPTERPDIILADIAMPKRSGYEVSAFVKGHPEFSKIPVLLLAGAFEPVDDAKAKEARCDGVLVKPFEPQQVIARVRELIGGAKGNPTQSAVQDIPRPAAALAPPRPVELPRREDKPAIPEDLMDVGEEDLMPRLEDTEPPGSAAEPMILDDSLDDYFDKLDEAFATINTSVAPGAGSPARADVRPARPDRPVLEQDLEPFDEPPMLEAAVAHTEPASHVAPDDPFAGLDAIQPEDAIGAIPTLDDLLASMPAAPETNTITFDDEPAAMTFEPPPSTFIPSAPPPPRSPAPRPSAPPLESASGRSIIADAFSALLAAEQGESASGASPFRLGGNGSSPVVTDAMVDDVARRVIQHLALGSSEQMQAIVKDIVSGIAERLVREEIDRIRRNA